MSVRLSVHDKVFSLHLSGIFKQSFRNQSADSEQSVSSQLALREHSESTQKALIEHSEGTYRALRTSESESIPSEPINTASC